MFVLRACFIQKRLAFAHREIWKICAGARHYLIVLGMYHRHMLHTASKHSHVGNCVGTNSWQGLLSGWAFLNLLICYGWSSTTLRNGKEQFFGFYSSIALQNNRVYRCLTTLAFVFSFSRFLSKHVFDIAMILLSHYFWVLLFLQINLLVYKCFKGLHPTTIITDCTQNLGERIWSCQLLPYTGLHTWWRYGSTETEL